jgi:HrpA-like RNA helicase
MPSSVLGARGPRDAETRQELARQLRHTRQQLPIWAGREAIVKAVREHDTVILMAETGSGKTTREYTAHSRTAALG